MEAVAQEQAQLSDGIATLCCDHLTSVQGPNGSRYHVAFNPTAETRRVVNEWKQSDDLFALRVIDRAGAHLRHIASRVLDTTDNFGTLVIHTNW